MSKSQTSPSFISRFLGPLLPLSFALYGIWILVTGSYSYRPGRSTRSITLLPPDSWFAAWFFFSLSVLLVAFGLEGRSQRVTFWTGLASCLIAIAVVGSRQILGLTVQL